MNRESKNVAKYIFEIIYQKSERIILKENENVKNIKA